MSLRTRADDAQAERGARASLAPDWPAPGSFTTRLNVHVDMRWRGNHGIGRYAQEVLPRLDIAWRPLALGGDPASPTGSMGAVPRHARRGLVYSPGYNSLLRARHQLVTVHDLIHLRGHGPGAIKYHAYYDGVLRPRLRRDRVVITVSETSRRAIAAWLNDDRVTIINAGIGCSPVFSVRGPVETDDEPYVLYVGNLRAHKNVDVVLEAFATLRGVRLRMVVPARDVDQARAKASAYGIRDRVTVFSNLSDERLASIYRGAAATLIPSRYEGFGLSALESICCGTPVIHWAGCEAVTDTVQHRGIAVQSADSPREWADGIQQLVRSATRVNPPVDGQFSWDATASIVSDAIRAMAA